jgi:hypothetical protein
MRYFLILLILFVAKQNLYSQIADTSNSSIFTNFVNSKTPIENALALQYKVFRIKKNDKAYIIDIDIREKTRYFRYTIISLKSEKQDLKNIKRGKKYKFVLFAYYPFIVVGDPIYDIYIVDGVRVGFMGDLKTGQIVTTPNLQGLYYIAEKKEDLEN